MGRWPRTSDRHHRRKGPHPVDRQKNLDVALGQIEKQFGKGSVMRMGEKTTMNIETVSTGAPSLDLALGIGGLPRGRVVEIFGPESSGKSTPAMHVVAEAQRNGGICAYIDSEHAMDPVYARAIGVDVDQLLISQPDTGEQALEIADMLVRSSALDVVVIDSVAALTPRAEIEGEMGDTHVGLQARLMSQALRKLTANLNKTNTICIFINQLREKIGVMFGSPETTPGGRALKFYSSVRLDIRRIESIKDGVEVVGNRTRVKVVKNKCAPPFKQSEFDIMYGRGISREGSLLDVGVDIGLVKKSGAWYTYDGEQLGQGRENAKVFLVDHPEVMVEISERIRSQLGIGTTPTPPPDAEHPVEGAGHPGQVEGVDQQAGVAGLPALAGAHEPAQLGLGAAFPLGRLVLEDAERRELARGLDDPFDALGAHGPDQLVLQVGHAHVEPECLHPVGAGRGAEPGIREPAPDVACLARVTQAGQLDVLPVGSVVLQERAHVRRTAHRHDPDALGGEVPTAPTCQRLQRGLVADPLDEHDHSNIVHRPSVARRAPI